MRDFGSKLVPLLEDGVRVMIYAGGGRQGFFVGGRRRPGPSPPDSQGRGALCDGAALGERVALAARCVRQGRAPRLRSQAPATDHLQNRPTALKQPPQLPPNNCPQPPSNRQATRT
jgi:hypothetical protein